MSPLGNCKLAPTNKAATGDGWQNLPAAMQYQGQARKSDRPVRFDHFAKRLRSQNAEDAGRQQNVKGSAAKQKTGFFDNIDPKRTSMILKRYFAIYVPMPSTNGR